MLTHDLHDKPENDKNWEHNRKGNGCNHLWEYRSTPLFNFGSVTIKIGFTYVPFSVICIPHFICKIHMLVQPFHHISWLLNLISITFRIFYATYRFLDESPRWIDHYAPDFQSFSNTNIYVLNKNKFFTHSPWYLKFISWLNFGHKNT